MPAPRKVIVEAAEELERMAAELLSMAAEFRAHPCDQDTAYAMAYHFRTRFGANIVGRLGRGHPDHRRLPQ